MHADFPAGNPDYLTFGRGGALSPELSFQLAEHAGHEALTPGEVSVLRLIAEGNSNKQIGRRLGLTEDTVKNRVKSILSKLGAEDRTQAVMIGLKRGIIEPP